MPNGTRTTFASGLNGPAALAFNSSGDLFEADFNSGYIYEFAPNGTQSTFASGLNNPNGLAFNSSGDLFDADYGEGEYLRVHAQRNPINLCRRTRAVWSNRAGV